MIGGTAPEPGSLLLLAQDRGQPPSDKTVKELELAGGGMFEGAEPPPKHGIEVGDDPPQTHTSASFRLVAHPILERFQAFLAHEPKTALEPITQLVESLARLTLAAD